MILAVAHQNISIRHNANTLESFEFWTTRTPRAEGLQERAVGTVNLYAIIARIGDYNITLIIYSDAPTNRCWTQILALKMLTIIFVKQNGKEWNAHRGNFSCPSSEPSEPIVFKTFPLTSKIWKSIYKNLNKSNNYVNINAIHDKYKEIFNLPEFGDYWNRIQ